MTARPQLGGSQPIRDGGRDARGQAASRLVSVSSGRSRSPSPRAAAAGPLIRTAVQGGGGAGPRRGRGGPLRGPTGQMAPGVEGGKALTWLTCVASPLPLLNLHSKEGSRPRVSWRTPGSPGPRAGEAAGRALRGRSQVKRGLSAAVIRLQRSLSFRLRNSS